MWHIRVYLQLRWALRTLKAAKIKGFDEVKFSADSLFPINREKLHELGYTVTYHSIYSLTGQGC